MLATFMYNYSELQKLYVEAKDNVKFLQTLDRHFKNISQVVLDDPRHAAVDDERDPHGGSSASLQHRRAHGAADGAHRREDRRQVRGGEHPHDPAPRARGGEEAHQGGADGARVVAVELHAGAPAHRVGHASAGSSTASGCSSRRTTWRACAPTCSRSRRCRPVSQVPRPRAQGRHGRERGHRRGERASSSSSSSSRRCRSTSSTGGKESVGGWTASGSTSPRSRR